jgi:carboxylesterase
MTMTTSNPNLYKQHRFSKPVPASEEEIALAKPFYYKNQDANHRIGCIVIHGFTSTPNSMLKIAEAVAKQCYITKAPLLPGHGTSPEDLANTTASDWTHYIDQQFQGLLEECDQIILIGQSLGGAIAAQIASKYPQQTSALFLLSPAFNTPFSVKIGCAIAPLAKILNIHFLDKQVGGDIKNKDDFEITYNRIPFSIFKQLDTAFTSGLQILPNITCPTTVFATPQDHVISFKKNQAAFKDIKSENKEFITLDNSYHVISQDNDIDNIIEHIQRNISQLIDSN